VPSTTALPGGFVGRLGVGVGAAGFAARLDGRVRTAALRWLPARPGERWAGAGGRPLGRALAAAGVPPEWRRAWPVLEADGTMIWVPGAGVLKGWDADVGPGVDVGLEVPW
jgi:hypothetical protein